MDGSAWKRRRDGDIFYGIDSVGKEREQADLVRRVAGAACFSTLYDWLEAAMKSVLHIFKKTVRRPGKYLVFFPDNIKMGLHLWF